MICAIFICTLFVLLSVSNAVLAQRVTLDYFFNHEVDNVAGISQRQHYLWKDTI